MARKKSISGRSRGLTIESRLIRNIEKTNKALNRLEKVRAYGKYSSRKILNLANAPAFKYKRRSFKKFKLAERPSKLTKSEQLLYLKSFEKFLKSETSKISGIKKAETEVKERVKKSLGEIAEKKLTDEDVEDFYDMMYDSDFNHITNYISPSDEFALIQEAKEQDYTEDKFTKALAQISNIDNPSEDFRNKAKKLYNKYVL